MQFADAEEEVASPNQAILRCYDLSLTRHDRIVEFGFFRPVSILSEEYRKYAKASTFEQVSA